MADFLASYRLKLFDQFDYATFVGLQMNLARVRMQPAYAVLRGIKAALGKTIPADIFDAIAASDDEAQDMAFEAAFAANHAAARKAGMGMI